ncbi:hypothetical protein AB6D11_02690 [Vibrio splendidus]
MLKLCISSFALLGSCYCSAQVRVEIPAYGSKSGGNVWHYYHDIEYEYVVLDEYDNSQDLYRYLKGAIDSNVCDTALQEMVVATFEKSISDSGLYVVKSKNYKNCDLSLNFIVFGGNADFEEAWKFAFIHELAHLIPSDAWNDFNGQSVGCMYSDYRYARELYSDAVAYHYVYSSEDADAARVMYERFLKLRFKAASQMGASVEYYSNFYPVSVEPVINLDLSSLLPGFDADGMVRSVAKVAGC